MKTPPCCSLSSWVENLQFSKKQGSRKKATASQFLGGEGEGMTLDQNFFNGESRSPRSGESGTYFRNWQKLEAR